MSPRSSRLDSVCVYCGSSNAADPAFLNDAKALGEAIAAAGMRLVYGGGGVGLMGACAQSSSPTFCAAASARSRTSRP